MRVELVNPTALILEEIEGGAPQQSVALTYAFIIRQEGEHADWLKINRAIMSRWKGKTALLRVKKRAWTYVQDQMEVR